jgi:hypothetical protein
MRAGGRPRSWPWIGAFVAAGALVAFLWYDKPAPPQQPAAVAGEPLKLKLEHRLAK